MIMNLGVNSIFHLFHGLTVGAVCYRNATQTDTYFFTWQAKFRFLSL